MRRLLIDGAILASGILILGTPNPTAAEAMYGKAALVVRDRVTNQPLEGVCVTLQNADTMEKKRERTDVEGNTAVTDASGFAAARVYVGSTESGGQVKRVEIEDVHVVAEKSGYQEFDGIGRAFYIAMRKEKGTYLFLDEVLLAPVGSSEPSRIEPPRFRPEARVEPAWGDTNIDYVVRVRLHTPAVLVHEFDQPLLHVFIRAIEGVMKPAHGKEEGYRKSLIELHADGRAPDRSPRDGEYAGVIRHEPTSEPQVIDHLSVVMRAAEVTHWLFSDEGTHLLMRERRRTGLGLSRRENTVILTVLEVPIQWAVGPTAEAARCAYEQRFHLRPRDSTNGSLGATPRSPLSAHRDRCTDALAILRRGRHFSSLDPRQRPHRLPAPRTAGSSRCTAGVVRRRKRFETGGRGGIVFSSVSRRGDEQR